MPRAARRDRTELRVAASGVRALSVLTHGPRQGSARLRRPWSFLRFRRGLVAVRLRDRARKLLPRARRAQRRARRGVDRLRAYVERVVAGREMPARVGGERRLDARADLARARAARAEAAAARRVDRV